MLDVKTTRTVSETPSQPSVRSHVTMGPLSAVVAIALLRILSSYSWLSGAFMGKDAKFAPDFLAGSGLVQRITGGPNGGFVHTAINSGVSSWLTHSIVPNASFFAWMLALGEAVVGLSLLLGLFTRLGGFLAIVQCLVNIAVAAGMGADTIGHNYLLIILALAFIFTAAGRRYGIDALLIRRFPNSRLLRLLA